MKIAIGSDHAGVALKACIKSQFAEMDFIDVGTHSEESVDYPDYISQAALKVQKGEAPLGIVICGSGIGASIAANKHKGIRAALCTNEYMAGMSRRHNDANILALGARIISEECALSIVKIWLHTSFERGRHQRRIDKITLIEKGELL